LTLLNENKSKIRKSLSKKVYLKYIPELIFVIDHSFAKGDEISRLLKTDTVQQDITND
jgi:ribosome-binding factor A